MGNSIFDLGVVDVKPDDYLLGICVSCDEMRPCRVSGALKLWCAKCWNDYMRKS